MPGGIDGGKWMRAFQWLGHSCFWALLLVIFLIAGCGVPAAPKNAGTDNGDGGYTVTDAKGTEVRIPHKPQRILSLAIYTDEILLGVVPPERMVAISRYLDDPKESNVVAEAQKIPIKVTNPTAEQILGWQPDLVIANDWTTPEMVSAIRDMGIPVVVCGPGNSYADIQGSIRLVAASVDEAAHGQQVIDRMDAVLQDIEAKVAQIPENQRKKVVLLSIMTNYGGAGSAFDAMCRHAGVTNGIAAGGIKNGQTLTKEMLVKINPDILLLPNYDDHGTYDSQAFIRDYLEDPSLQTITAIRNQACYYPRESYVYNASQDFVFGVQEIAYCAYGEAFRQEDNRHISFADK